MVWVACTHRGGWSARTRGEARCRDCGTVRFTEYAALRPPGLPQATTASVGPDGLRVRSARGGVRRRAGVPARMPFVPGDI
ncbi:DUF6255 family natural product biosynthesis protein [Streptomyces roseifaciens]